jgi:hypothetical protein
LSKVSDVIYFWWACSIFEVPAEVRHNGKLSPPTPRISTTKTAHQAYFALWCIVAPLKIFNVFLASRFVSFGFSHSRM